MELKVNLEQYTSLDEFTDSDHKPVIALYSLLASTVAVVVAVVVVVVVVHFSDSDL